MPFKQNVAGTWKTLVWWTNVAGTWKKCSFKTNVAGTWKTLTSLFGATLPAAFDLTQTKIAPLNAAVYIDLQSSGAYVTQGVGTGGGTWLTGGGVGADYEARFTPTLGSVSSGTVNTWLSLASSRSWSVNENRDFYASKACDGILEIRLAAAPNTVLATSTVSMEAIVEI